MLIGKYFRRLSRALALMLVIGLCLSPAVVDALQGSQADITAAVPAPSPLTKSAAPAAAYHERSALLAGFSLSREQQHTLISRMDSSLEARLKADSVTAEQLAYCALPSYRDDYSARYQRYAAKYPYFSPAQVVAHVNMELDVTFYYQPDPVADPDSTTVLVNKHYALSPDYAPQVEVLGPGYGVGSLRSEAAQAFRAMADAALADGLTLRSVSAYRSYRTQELLYARYLAQNTQDVVDDFSARPGHSEHQTGLALDINVARSSAHFENSAEYAWLLENCARFGFILRYPQGKESITGYRFEPWHYRYVGTEIASVCMERELTYEEYVATLPAGSANALPSLSFNGQFLRLEQPPVYLEDSHYLSAEALAHALGFTASEMIDSSALTLYKGSKRLILTPGIRYQCDDWVCSLTSSALELNGSLYLTLEDLCTVLELDMHTTDFGLELTDRSNP